MKITCAASFALGLFQTGSAFQSVPAFHRPDVSTSHNVASSRLFSSRDPSFGSRDPNENYASDLIMNKEAVGSPEQTRTRVLEERLAALEKGDRKGGVKKGARKPDVLVQGGSLKTWSMTSPSVKRVLVELGTEGRPLDADIELWQGPDNTPHKMRVYLEDGSLRPFKALIETPRGPNTVAIRNIGQLEFPLSANVNPDSNNEEPLDAMSPDTTPLIIQGGALRTYPCESNIESVQVLLKTDGRPLSARIELLQGPNNIKQIIELYTEDGMDRPFYTIIESPGSGNVVRVVNTATVEFPMTAWVEPLVIGEGLGDIVISDDQSGGFDRR